MQFSHTQTIVHTVHTVQIAYNICNVCIYGAYIDACVSNEANPRINHPTPGGLLGWWQVNPTIGWYQIAAIRAEPEENIIRTHLSL